MRNGENPNLPCLDDVFEDKRDIKDIIETPDLSIEVNAGFCDQKHCDRRFDINTGKRFGSCALRRPIYENLGDDLIGHIGTITVNLSKRNLIK